MRIDHEISVETIHKMAEQSQLLRYGANTCWWGMDEAPWYNTKPDGSGLPCDPRGGMLFETDKPLDFVSAAENEVSSNGVSGVYGKYKLRTFLLAYHGCVVTDNGKPTCFRTWAEYERLLDLQALSEVSK